MQTSPLVTQSKSFALNIISVYKSLTEQREYVLSKQLLRSGTAIGALVAEAQNAESGPDFIHKYAIAQKEAGETCYWLDLLGDSGFLATDVKTGLTNQAKDLLRMLRSAILTRKTNLRR